MIKRRRWGRTAAETLELKLAFDRDGREDDRRMRDSWTTFNRLENRVVPLAVELKVFRKGVSPGSIYAVMSGQASQGGDLSPIDARRNAKKAAAAARVQEAVRLTFMAWLLHLRPEEFEEQAKRVGLPERLIRTRDEPELLRRADAACSFAEGFLTALSMENAPRLAGGLVGAAVRRTDGDDMRKKVCDEATKWRHLTINGAAEKVATVVGRSSRRVADIIKEQWGDGFQIKK